MLSLHAVTIPAFRQTLDAVAGLLAKAEAFAAERGIDPQTLVTARLAPDMNDFAYQVKSVAVHSLGAIEGVRRGTFGPDHTPPPSDFAGLAARIAAARAGIDALDPAEVDGFVGRDMVFVMGSRRIEYAAEDFLMSFSLPNFYFHAATAYGILRHQGVPIGKIDFIGRPRYRAITTTAA